MTNGKDIIFEKQITFMNKNSKMILEQFRQVISNGVTNPELLSILDEIKNYWTDKLRSTLIAFSFEAVGGQFGETDTLSLISTLLGAGIGVHDDIIDKCYRKHFRRTILGTHDIDSALLAGDLLIVKSLTMVRKLIMTDIEPKKISDILETLELCLIKVCESQFEEISFRRNLNISLNDYLKFLSNSVAEMEACTKIGAILGDGSDKEVQLLGDFGKNFGVMQRLLSDIADSRNIEGNLDRRLDNESIPLSILYSAKSSKESFNKICSILNKTHITQKDVMVIPEICFNANAFSYLYGLAEKISKEINKNLMILSYSLARESLSLLVNTSLASIAEISL